jgi:hypothetical protein
MTPEAIYRALCALDPALEPWQKCEHEYVSMGDGYTVSGTKRPTVLKKYRCAKCRKMFQVYETNDTKMPTFGDGKPRYNSVDELLALCVRLKLVWHVISDSENAGVWIFTQSGETHLSASLTSASTDDPVMNAVLGLQEAILRTMGKWTEVQS